MVKMAYHIIIWNVMQFFLNFKKLPNFTSKYVRSEIINNFERKIVFLKVLLHSIYSVRNVFFTNCNCNYIIVDMSEIAWISNSKVFFFSFLSQKKTKLNHFIYSTEIFVHPVFHFIATKKMFCAMKSQKMMKIVNHIIISGTTELD